MTARRTLPRRGLADPAWTYVPADQTDIRKTIRAEQQRLASPPIFDGSSRTLEERAAVRQVIAELHDAPADVPLPAPVWRPEWKGQAPEGWQYIGAGVFRMRDVVAQSGRLDPDAAVALIALGLLAAAVRAGLF